MRRSLQVLMPTAALLVACSSTTGPELPPPDDLGVLVLAVAPSFSTIEGEQFVKLTPILSGSGSRGVPLSEVAWSSSDSNVATVREGGLVQGRKAGRVHIAATWKTAHGSATVVVLNLVGKKPNSPGFPTCIKRLANAGHLSIPEGGKC